jgi:selenocysteine-specific elongation factor
MVLTAPGLFRAVDRIECRLDLLASARPLRHRAPVHFHSGTAEIEAEVRRVEGAGPVNPGTTAYVRIALRAPALVLPGDRFIVRMFSPVVTIGGGVVIDIHPPRGGTDARLGTLEHGSVEERIALLVRESRYGLDLPELVARTGLLPAELERFATIRQWFLDPARAAALSSEIRDALAEFHDRNPLAEGMPKEALRTAVLPGAPPFVFDALLGDGVVTQSDVVRLAGHRVVLKQDEERASAALERVFLDAGLTVPSLGEALAKSGIEPARARSVLQLLLRNGTLVRVSEDLVFHRTAIDRLRELLAAHRGRRIAVPEFKDLAGVSRKYAIPLLEYLDRARVTRRDGDFRIVL